MALFVFDTDVLSLAFTNHPAVVARMRGHQPDELTTTVVTVAEVITGRQGQLQRARSPVEIETAYHMLGVSVTLLGPWRKLEFTEAAIRRFQDLRSNKLGVKDMNDLRIAAIVLEHDATLVTRNARDFQRVPGLKHLNWVD